ncbi:MAG: hypothetical protein WCD89_06795 [Anaerocolumna sp.]
MLIEKLIRLFLTSLSYIILIFGLAYIMLKPLTWIKTISDKVLLYFVTGNFYVINIIYLLLFLRCSSRFLTIAVLLSGAFLVRYFINKNKFRKSIAESLRVFALLSEGIYGWNFFYKEKRRSLRSTIKSKVLILIKKNLFETISLFICLGIHAYYIGYRFVYYNGFGSYDELVHLEWVQNMQKGVIFSDGIYPFGLHNILYALIKVFGFKAFTVMRYFGFILVMCLGIMLYLLIKKVCRLKYLPILGLFLYVASDLYLNAAWDRLQYTLPEEFGMLFLYPVFIYLYHYLRDKEQKYLILFGISFTLTIYVHYYVTIIALLLCLCVGISRIFKIFKEKLFLKIILCGFISTLIGILPMGIGIATGHGFQGSMYWAIGVLTGKSVDHEESGDYAKEQAEVKADTTALITYKGNMADKLIAAASSTKEKAVTTVLHNNVFKVILFAMFLIFINTVFRNLFHKTQNETFLQFSLLLYSLILLIMLNSAALGLPIIIQDYRVSVFLSYIIPLFLCIPLELGYEIFEKSNWSALTFRIAVISFIGLAVYSVYADGCKRQLSRFTLLQSDSSVKVLYDILEKYEDDTWTIVSPVDEYSIVLDSGFHYEWTDFLFGINHYNDETSVYIPTENIFFFIEKRPIAYGSLIPIGQEIPNYEEITKKDAGEEITDEYMEQPSKYYSDQELRTAIMARAYYWAQKYRYYFPNEMTVYYEDDNFICYHLKQEPYYLNNLAIDYGYNVTTGE